MSDDRRSSQGATIGLLLHGISDSLGATLWAGAADAARAGNANLVCFAGGMLHSPHGFDAQRNSIFDLVSAETVDGLVVWTGILSHYVERDTLAAFLARWREAGLPIVCVEVPMPGTPSLLIDFRRGMRSVVAHLIEVHGHRRIAFIRGPEGSSTADERYQAYVDTLEEHGIPFDPALVAPGTFFAPSGAEAVRLLLDERGLRPEAIVAANDNMAIDALQALQARGLRVSRDLAVAGFDDLEEAELAAPPLTTAHLSLYDLGRRATELLLARLRGEAVPDQEMLTAALVVRQSCGCPAPEVARAGAGAAALALPAGKADLPAHREQILATTLREVQAVGARPEPARVAGLFDVFVAGLGEKTPARFLSTLAEIMHREAEAGGTLSAWHEVVSALRRQTLPHLSGEAVRLHAEDLWQQARVLIGRTTERMERVERLQASRQSDRLREVGQALVASSSVAELVEIAVRDLPALGIPSAYLCLYEDPAAPAGPARMVLAYGSPEAPAPEGSRFPAGQLAPAGALRRQASPAGFVVEPLYFRENPIGYLLLEAGTQDRQVYEVLRGEFSSALWGARLLERAQRRALQLQTAAEVSRAASSILDPDQLLPHVVELIRERFDLYYAGLFLVDKDGAWTGWPNKWAVLRAGTGEAGKKMLQEKHRLEVGGRSMVGQCVASGEARIELDAGHAGLRHRNPLLPETRAEMALPLLSRGQAPGQSRGQAIGALTIQSRAIGAFGPEDITVLQTMADQIANAIENTRLLSQTEQALKDLEAVQRRYIRQAWSDYLKKD